MCRIIATTKERLLLRRLFSRASWRSFHNLQVVVGLFLPLVVVRFIEFRDADDSNHVVPLEDDESFSSSSPKFEFLRKRSSSSSSVSKMRSRDSRCCGRFFGNLCSFFAAPFVKFGYFTVSWTLGESDFHSIHYLFIYLFENYFLIVNIKCYASRVLNELLDFLFCSILLVIPAQIVNWMWFELFRA